MLQSRVLAMRSKHCTARRLVAALTALCFAVLVSIAASHLHIGPDGDGTCAVCAAVAGKVAGASAPPITGLSLEHSGWLQIVESPLPFPRTRAVVLPPSCGPPSCP
jgi:hypothetical protein